MRNKDLAEKQTDKMIDELEKKIAKIYSKAQKDLEEKYLKYSKAFQIEDEKRRKELQENYTDENVEKYNNWRKNKFFTEQRYKEMFEVLSEDLVKADQKAMSVANGFLPEAYALNFNYETYDMEQNTQLNTSFTLYSRESVERLERGGRKILPKRKVDIPKDKAWNMKHLRNEITQGILQGKSIPNIAKELKKVTDMDRRAAIRNARTMMTGAQNGGRMAAYDRAAKLGVNIQKEWMATLDARTRDSHQKMDGERVDYKKAFSNGLMFPGDPDLDPDVDPSEVYNCRCTMVPFYPEYADITEKRITYDEWKLNKEEIKLNKEKDKNKIKLVLTKKEKQEFEKEEREIYSKLSEMSEKEAFKTIKNFYKKYQDGTADENSFFTETIAEFKEIAKRPNRKPDYISNSGSEYWYSKDGVIRGADHWGDSVASCSWALKGEKEEFYGNAWFSDTGQRYGKTSWDEFTKFSKLVSINSNEFVLTTFENNSQIGILKYNGKKYRIVMGRAVEIKN